jgi:hypothetical protein
MKKIINQPENFVNEMIEGILHAHSCDIKKVDSDLRELVRADAPVQGKVAIATGGGSGHLPVFLGYVGKGLLDGVAVGDVFASPSAQQMFNVTKQIHGGKGVLYLYGNYGGDVMNFDMAAEMADMDTASQVGTRASRMLDGEHILTIDELKAGVKFDDTLCVAQPPYKGFSTSDPYKYIPYRSFVPKSVGNLLVAGRCISGDFRAIEMLRVIPTAMLMGQACGAAAAVAADSGVKARNMSIQEVQNRLRKQGVYLP